METMSKPSSSRDRNDLRNSSNQVLNANGIQFESVFCPEDVDSPFDTTLYELRSAQIKDDNGNLLFEQKDCEIPAAWSQLATNVVVSKYFFGENGTKQREKGVRQLIHRVTRTIADWGIADGYFATSEDGERFYRDLSWLCLHQCGSFNSPVWFNVGLYHQYGVTGAACNWHWNSKTRQTEIAGNSYEFPQASACFIQSVDDDMEDIMRLASSEAMLFKFGSGTGTDLSTLRSSREKLAGGGRPSGPLSFMRVYDQIAAVVKSGGKTRRAAKMQSLKVTHPDVLEFIECKWKEEQKAHTLIASGKYEANFNGEAYSSILFQNANLSIRVTDDFMQQVESDGQWTTHWVTQPTVNGPEYSAKWLLGRMAECAWQCGDPGVQYDTTINHWHTCPMSGRINASNPCSEYMFLDNTACNLASVNLMKFRCPDGTFDVDRFGAACRAFFIAQEILVGNASYPTARIAENSDRFRPLGLGYSNLGSLMMADGIAYDSEEGLGLCGALTAILHAAGNLASSELARAVGPFDQYENNRQPMLAVMQKHRAAVEDINSACPGDLKKQAQSWWDRVVDQGRKFGFRNAQATVLAPTGTISFMMDCDTTGIEPDISLVKYKQLAGGGMLKIVNRTVPFALQQLGYNQQQIDRIQSHIDEHDTIEGAVDLKLEHLSVFDCAFKPANGSRSIAWPAHVKMMAAAQPFLSGAISKTVNMPTESTPADISDAYVLGWKLGLKALAVYRDGSKLSQPLSTQNNEKKTETAVAQPRRERLPDTRSSLTHKFNVNGHEGYITVGLYPDGRPGELFITMAKEGSTFGGLMDAFGTAISMSLQYGVPLEVLVNKFSHARFEPMGFTTNKDIRIATSVVDYIFRWLAIAFLARATHNDCNPGHANELGIGADNAKAPEPNGTSGKVSGVAGSNGNGFKSAIGAASATEQNEHFASYQSDAPACDHCGAITVRSGNCYLCHNCGNSMGCS